MSNVANIKKTYYNTVTPFLSNQSHHHLPHTTYTLFVDTPCKITDIFHTIAKGNFYFFMK